ncbi:MAG: hypothetical protein MJE77_33090 [Proteobacteria bacterium]|nr:hypothetical protein [Pseudomonadota bacterium]
MADPYGTDLRLVFVSGDEVDLALGAGDVDTVSGTDNLVQALTLRLVVDRGELAGLGHPRYGTRIRELVGEPLDRANRELLRRFVRRTLLDDWRVQEVTRVAVSQRPRTPGVVDVIAHVVAVSGEQAVIEVALHVD